MKTQKQAKARSKQNEHTLIDISNKLPDDIVDLNEQFDKQIIEKQVNLFDYFSQKDGSSIIRNWSKSLSKKEIASEMQSYKELLCLILQISGLHPDMNEIQIEKDSFDTVLEEFRNKMEKSKQIPPLYKFLKNKSNKIDAFWKEISESLITNSVFTSDVFKHFIEWIIAFNCCKIRVIRKSSAFFVFSLFECLANSISWRKSEIKKYQQKSTCKSKAQTNDQISLFQNEITLYTSVAIELYKKLIIVRVRDIDEVIRILSIKSLTNAIIINDAEFFEEQKLKYIGRALNDTSANNRLEAIKCFEKIIVHATESLDENNFSYTQKNKKSNEKVDEKVDEQDDNQEKIKNVLIDFSEMYSPRIIEMCNDSDEEVAAEAISCVEILTEHRLVNSEDCECIQNLISDDSSMIRKAAANFVAKRAFFDENDDLDHFLLFLQNFHAKNYIQFAVSSLYPYLKCLKKWNEMCDRLISEENDNRSKILSAVLLYSAKMAVNTAEEYSKNNNSKTKNFQETADIEKSAKKVRKLTFILIQNLPQLLKAYQSSKSKEVIQNLVETSSLLDLNAISENSNEKQYENLLNQLHEIFIKFNQDNEENVKIFNSAFNSIYILSKNHNHLSEIAQKELDKLSMIFSEFGSDDDDIENDENLNFLLSKFAVAAKIVDISSNEKLKNKILLQLNQILKKYESLSQPETENTSDSDQDDNENEEQTITNSIQCLQYYFKWDVKKIHDFLINKKINEGEDDKVVEKIEKIKEPYIKEFHEFSNIFASFIKSQKASLKIKLAAFKALGANISLSPILIYETATGLAPPTVSSSIINNDISDIFYHFFHEMPIKMKVDVFEIAELPLVLKTIDVGYSAHLLVYNCISFQPNEEQTAIENDKNQQDSRYAAELNEKVKKLWKNLAKFQPINGKQLYSAFSLVYEKSPSMKIADLKKISRFFVGKFKVFDFIKEWAENNFEDEQFLPVVATFLFGLNESDANQLRVLLSDRFADVLDKISNGLKLTAKDIVKLQIDRKATKKKMEKSANNRQIKEKSKKTCLQNQSDEIVSDDEIEIVESTDEIDDDTEEQIKSNESHTDSDDAEEQIKSNESHTDSDDAEEQIKSNESHTNSDDAEEQIKNNESNIDDDDDSESTNKEDDYEPSSDVQEIDPDEYDENNEIEVEFEEPDETFVFKN